jgi:hypothetical protein
MSNLRSYFFFSLHTKLDPARILAPFYIVFYNLLTIRTLTLIMMLMALSPGVSAQEIIKPWKTVQGWGLFVDKQSKKPLCYLATSPIRQQGNIKKRTEAALMILLTEGNHEEVSVTSGYNYKKDHVSIRIDHELFHLFSQDHYGWSKTKESDKRLMNSLKKGKKAIVIGYTQQGGKSEDHYDLSSVGNAHSLLKQHCQQLGIK